MDRHTPLHTSTSTRARMHTHAQTCTCMLIHLHANTYTAADTHKHKYTCTHTLHKFMHTNVHKHAHVYAHTCMHTHMQICTPAPSPPVMDSNASPARAETCRILHPWSLLHIPHFVLSHSALGLLPSSCKSGNASAKTLGGLRMASFASQKCY